MQLQLTSDAQARWQEKHLLTGRLTSPAACCGLYEIMSVVFLTCRQQLPCKKGEKSKSKKCIEIESAYKKDRKSA
jgi:hypothetical protein